MLSIDGMELKLNFSRFMDQDCYIFARLHCSWFIICFGGRDRLRGWLLPRFQWMGRVSSSVTMGLIWAIWHYPAILGPRAYHSSGSRWLVVVLFTLSVMFAGIIINELRLTSGSIWVYSAFTRN